MIERGCGSPLGTGGTQALYEVFTFVGLRQEPVQHPKDIGHGLHAQVLRELIFEVDDVGLTDVPDVQTTEKGNIIFLDIPFYFLK